MKIKIDLKQDQSILLVTGEKIELKQGINELIVTPLLAERLGEVVDIEICEEVGNEDNESENPNKSKTKKNKVNL